MNVLTCFQKREHDDALRQCGMNNEVTITPLHSVDQVEKYGQADAFIFDDAGVDFVTFCDAVETVRSISAMPVVVIFPSDCEPADDWKRYCLSQHVLIICADRITRLIVEQITEIVLNRQSKKKQQSSGKTIMFAGTTPNIGTTVAAFGAALSLA